jgi:hypothetical protein
MVDPWLNWLVTAPVCIESGTRRVFASALEWPGWCRSGRSEDEALATLVAYAGRYAPVCGRAGVRFDTKEADRFEVVERLAGNATTEFGAPAIPAEYERQPLAAEGAARSAALVAACWQILDEIVAAAPRELKKGPRGGGHVAQAELAYARKLDVRALRDPTELRKAITDVLARPSDGRAVLEKGWPPRYAARRIAWHVLDHAWEIEDRS